MWEIAVDLVYSLKTKRRFNSHAKCAVWVSTKLTSLLLVVMTSTVATASKKVKMVTSTHNLPISYFILKVIHFLLSRINKLDRDFLYWKILSLVGPLRSHVTSVLEREQRWGASWVRSILVACEQALCLGKKSLFPLPSSPLDQRPVHRLISSWHSCFKISHSRAFRVCCDSGCGIFSFALGLLFRCT